jgi:beta-mannosidase
MDFKGKKLSESIVQCNIPANSSKTYFNSSTSALLNGNNPGDVFLLTRVFENNTLLSENILLMVPPKDLNLPKPKIETQIKQDAGGYFITLESATFAKNVFIEMSDKGFFTDNYFDLLPGKPLTIFCKTAVLPSDFEAQLKIVSLAETYD